MANAGGFTGLGGLATIITGTDAIASEGHSPATAAAVAAALQNAGIPGVGVDPNGNITYTGNSLASWGSGGLSGGFALGTQFGNNPNAGMIAGIPVSYLAAGFLAWLLLGGRRAL